jgi:arabinogalactan oligomer / maltooligosaccharide transport system permease protein
MATLTTVNQIRPHKRMSFLKWFRMLGWRHLVALAAIAFALFPFLWMASAAFDNENRISNQTLIPAHIGLSNFHALFNNPNYPYLSWIRNSIFISTLTAFLQLVVATTAAYALSRFRYKGRKLTLMTILVVQMFPQLLALSSIYLILADLGKSIPFMHIGNISALIVVFVGGALGVNAWMLKGFFDTVPQDLDESARIDGATHAQIYVQIILPLVRPVLSVIFLLSFIGTMNEYVITSVIIGTSNPAHTTVAVGLQGFISAQYNANWGPFAAGSLIASIPVIVLFMFLQRFVVTGLTAGSTKG